MPSVQSAQAFLSSLARVGRDVNFHGCDAPNSFAGLLRDRIGAVFAVNLDDDDSRTRQGSLAG